MKKVLLLTIPLLFTGCASVGNHIQDRLERSLMNPIELAQRDCTTMGFTANTQQFHQCVMVTANNIRNNRAAIAAAEASRPQQSFLPPVPPPQTQWSPQGVSCQRRIGNRVECSTY